MQHSSADVDFLRPQERCFCSPWPVVPAFVGRRIDSPTTGFAGSFWTGACQGSHGDVFQGLEGGDRLLQASRQSPRQPLLPLSPQSGGEVDERVGSLPNLLKSLDLRLRQLGLPAALATITAELVTQFALQPDVPPVAPNRLEFKLATGAWVGNGDELDDHGDAQGAVVLFTPATETVEVVLAVDAGKLSQTPPRFPVVTVLRSDLSEFMAARLGPGPQPVEDHANAVRASQIANRS